MFSVPRERSKLDKLSHAAVHDTPRLDKAVRAQSDSESSSDDDDDDDDDDDEDITVTRCDESGPAAEAAGAVADISVSWLLLNTA